MIIPESPAEKEKFVRMIISSCMVSQKDRNELYQKRRRYYLYGQDQEQKVRFNRGKSHMNLISSFLFSPESLTFNITPPRHSDEKVVQRYLAFQDNFNDSVADSGVADVFSEAVLWGLIYDSMIMKMGWNDTTGQMFGSLIEPSNFGVYLENNSDFAAQPAMNHSYLLDYDDACQRLTRAGRADMISSLQIEGASTDNGLPPALQQMIISAVTGPNLTSGGITGSVNPNYQPTPTFRAKMDAPMVQWNETWVWDTKRGDYRIFHSLGEGILLSDSLETIQAIRRAGNYKAKLDSDTNWFLAKENPFIPITPHSLYNYLWGDCHFEDIIPLQEWSNKRLEQIDEILERQEDPSKVFAGFQGISDEKAEAMGSPGTWMFDSTPGAEVKELRPPMPEDLFREFNEIGSLMLEASGLTEITAGRSAGGARGGQQQKQLQVTGGGQIKKIAAKLEAPLVRMADLGMKLRMKNDDDEIHMPNEENFLPAQLEGDVAIRVAGHSHSPLFVKETEEQAALLFKARAIDEEWLIRMLPVPEKQNLLHALKKRKEDAQRAEAQRAAMGQTEQKKGKK